jgi:thioredoxin 1
MESITFSGLLVLKFYSDTCAPCKRLNPIIEKMTKEFPSVKIYNINIDEDYKLAKDLRIMSVPTLVFMSGDKENQRIEGLANTETVRKTFKCFAG